MKKYYTVDGIKRRNLSDIECMSGTGWYSEEHETECPECGFDAIWPTGKKSIDCPECGAKFKVEYGMQLLMRLVEK